MKTTIKTVLAALMLLTAISCKKENSTIQSAGINGENNLQVLLTGSNEPEMYASVKLGGYVVMKRNLNVSHYRNGDIIPQVRGKVAWAALTTGAWCWYNNDSANGAIYGKLYNWFAVNDPRGLAPAGWHIPSDAEWTTLTTLLGGNAGGKMKSTGTIEAGTGLWHDPNTGATNGSGFTGLPGGYRSFFGTFGLIGFNGYWWSSTENLNYYAWYRYLYYTNSFINRYYDSKQNGFSVRCVRD